jgi:hypothetical protein
LPLEGFRNSLQSTNVRIRFRETALLVQPASFVFSCFKNFPIEIPIFYLMIFTLLNFEQQDNQILIVIILLNDIRHNSGRAL